MLKSTRDIPSSPAQPNARRRAVLDTARDLGLLGGQNGRIGGRVRRDLVAAAKKKSGITSDIELLEYALAKVARRRRLRHETHTSQRQGRERRRP
jgi:hypothetical protein